MKLRPVSLGTRLTLSFLAIIVVTAGVIVLLTNRIMVNRFTYMVSGAGQAYARRLAPAFAAYYVRNGSWSGVEILMAAEVPVVTAMSNNDQPGRGSVRGTPGELVPRGMRGMVNSAMLDGDIERIALFDAGRHIVADSDPDAAPLSLRPEAFERGAPIVVDNEVVGILIVASALGDFTARQNEFLQQVNGLVLLVAGLVGVIVLILGRLEARRLSAPVRALAAAAQNIAAGDLAQRVPDAGVTELSEMATAFNTMAARLEEQQMLRRQVMADIAHELRTPLSVLQIDLESLEDGLVEPTDEVVGGLQAEVAHLNRLVEDLRTLSLADAGELYVEMQPLDLVELAREVAARVQGAARERGIALTMTAPDVPLPVLGDSQRLAQVLLNLLSNALRHTPDGGSITVTVVRRDAEAQIAVADTGEGIPAKDLPYVFERFYRVDPARARENGGSGLGLAISRSLVAAHNGRLWVESVEGKGSTFTLALPSYIPSRGHVSEKGA
ncbi:MAG: HAMP domain-containing protein [Anaerolineae bacterium]|nr:HAMP domain-containing protein [Anaerolineae bacterium]